MSNGKMMAPLSLGELPLCSDGLEPSTARQNSERKRSQRKSPRRQSQPRQTPGPRPLGPGQRNPEQQIPGMPQRPRASPRVRWSQAPEDEGNELDMEAQALRGSLESQWLYLRQQQAAARAAEQHELYRNLMEAWQQREAETEEQRLVELRSGLRAEALHVEPSSPRGNVVGDCACAKRSGAGVASCLGCMPARPDADREDRRQFKV